MFGSLRKCDEQLVNGYKAALTYACGPTVESLCGTSPTNFTHNPYICHGRKSNLAVESPIGVSTNINLVESPIGVSTGRKSNLGDLGIAWESEI